MVPPCTNAELRNQSIREKVIVVETCAIRVLKASPFKIALRWSAADTEYGGLENGWTLVAKSHAQAIFVGKVGVHFTIKVIRIFVERQQSKVVIRVACARRGRDEVQELGGDAVNQGRGYDVGATGCIRAGMIVGVHGSSIGSRYRRHAGS